MIDEQWPHSGRKGHKTHYSRRKARSRYLSIAKQKRPKSSRVNKAIDQQLGYVKSNIDVICELLMEAGSEKLELKRLERLMTICELHRQQRYMRSDRSHKCENRIVSLRQPHVRPIVRGKAGRRFEFGQKLGFAVVDGYTFIENQSFDNFNEGVTLIESAERYKRTYGAYPEAILADQIYRNRRNLDFCKSHGIRLSGPKLGRPSKNAVFDRETEYRDRCERNIVESRNGIAKRRFGLDRIMAYLHDTALTEAALAVFCMNVHLKSLLRVFRRFLLFPSECYVFLVA